ncbi:Uncharacterised protein [Candidatus Burarchaeum australiense]|nr:Uncharacterised protein [Candidatus Burarchaeum australiense]
MAKFQKTVEVDDGARDEPEDGAGEALAPKGEKPDLRIVQPGTDAQGNATFRNVGGMWKGTSKAGNEFYNLRIGHLKLLVFPNKRKTD